MCKNNMIFTDSKTPTSRLKVYSKLRNLQTVEEKSQSPGPTITNKSENQRSILPKLACVINSPHFKNLTPKPRLDLLSSCVSPFHIDFKSKWKTKKSPKIYHSNVFKHRIDTPLKRCRTRSLTPHPLTPVAKSYDEDLKEMITEYGDNKKTLQALARIVDN